MRYLNFLCVSLAITIFAPTAAFAHDGGQGLYGEIDDKVITNFGFALIAFFPLFAFIMSLLQWKLDKRKETRKEAEKNFSTSAAWRGGW